LQGVASVGAGEGRGNGEPVGGRESEQVRKDEKKGEMDRVLRVRSVCKRRAEASNAFRQQRCLHKIKQALCNLPFPHLSRTLLFIGGLEKEEGREAKCPWSW
jgi:hypothetical protein